MTQIEPQAFLTSKMVAVLQALSYNTASINTLINRADSNTISATGVSPDSLLDKDSISTFLETTFLNEQSLRQRNIYLNSNEPVILIEVSQTRDFNTQQIGELKDRVLSSLRDRNVKPVRVYIRETTDVEDAELHFSLLNVVNSDIGINMVSLLDRAFYGPEWKSTLR